MRFRQGVFSWSCFVILSLVGTAQATGPSSADIEIIPLAVNGQGVVLCKTVSQINLMGSQTLEGTEYGWLALSAEGVWDEVIYQRIGAEMAEGGERLDSVMRSYAQRTDLRDALPSLQKMMDKYGFSHGDSLESKQILPVVTWHDGRFCVGKKCHDGKISQRTLKGIISNDDGGSAIRAHFVADGVALFDNRDYTEVEEGKQGAIFGVANWFEGHDIGVDLQKITGVVFFPSSLRKGM